MQLPDTVLLLSGGLDSLTLAYDLCAQGRLGVVMFFDYGQPAAFEECEAVELFRKAHDAVRAEVVVLDLEGMIAMLQEPGAEGPRIVPARNLVLIAHAANYASAHGYRRVAIGATAGDHAAYIDCRAHWLGVLSTLTEAAAGVSVEAPSTAWTKRQVAERAVELGVPIDTSWSCYTPMDGHPCHRCNACREREAVT